MEKNIHLHERKSKLHIQRKDLASLDPEQWLTDTVIEAYMTSFAETTTLYVLPSIQASSIAEHGFTKTGIRKQLAHFEFIAGPIHIDKNHWALLFIDVGSQTVVYIDSRGENGPTTNKVLMNWNLFCRGREIMKDIKWNPISYSHVIQSTSDCSNCGVFACYFFKNLLNQNAAKLNSTFDINIFRNEIRSVIEKNSKKNKKYN